MYSGTAGRRGMQPGGGIDPVEGRGFQGAGHCRGPCVRPPVHGRVGRGLAQRLGERMGQTFVVENRAWAAGNIGAEAVAKCAPDGDTTLLAITSVSINPALLAKMPFDIMKDLAPLTLPSVLPFVRSGRIRALAVTTAQRSPMVPDVPTMIESGVKDFDFAEWYGLFVPSGVPREVVRRLNEASVGVLKTADVRDRFAVQGLEVLSSTPEQFGELVQRDLARFGDVIRRAGIKVE